MSHSPRRVHIPGLVDLEWQSAGRTAEVFVGTESSCRRRVAVKLFAPDVPTARIDHEATVFARASLLDGVVGFHRAVNAVTEGGPQRRGLQMDLCDRSLGWRRRRSGAMEPALVIAWGSRLAASLGALHRRGIAHRDITDDHVLFADDQVRWCDFGAASLDGRVADSTTRRQLTPAFAAPERFAPGRLDIDDRRGDVYSLGAVLATALLGREPYGRPEDGGWTGFRSRLGRDPLPLGCDGAPPALAELIRRTMDIEPDRRPDAADLASELEALRTGADLDRTVWFDR